MLDRRRPTFPKLGTGFARLESREVPAGNIIATFTNGLLQIQGTEDADRVSVIEQSGQVSLNNFAIQILVNGVPQPAVSAQDLARIEVNTLGGDDFVAFTGVDIGALRARVTIS
jgi:hypothetical protein